MTDTLEPIHTISLGPTLTGEVAQAELQFALENGKPVLYAAVPVWNATWGRWFMWHAPEIMVGVWLVVLIVLVRRLLHVRRTPRETGRRYCRKCNHQLTKPQLAFDERGRVQWASAEARCPECGYRSRRVPVRGRAGWMRRVLFIACALPILIVLGLMIVGSLQPAPPPTIRATPTWPIAYLDHFMGRFAVSRRLHPALVQSTQFLRIDADSGSWLRLPISPPASPGPHGTFLSPNGRRIVARSIAHNGLITIDLATRRVSEVIAPGSLWNDVVEIDVHRFLTDDRVVVQTVRRTSMGELVALDHVDLRSNSFERLLEVSMPASAVWHRFESALVSDRLCWILYSMNFYSNGQYHNQVRWMTPDGLQVRDLPGTSTAPTQVSLDADGRSFEIWTTNPPNEKISLDPKVMPSLQPIEPTIQPEPNTTPAPVRWSQLRPADGSVVLVAGTVPERRFTLAGVISPSSFWMSDTPNGPLVAVTVPAEVQSRYKQILTGEPERLEAEIRIFRIPDPTAK